jgi:regulator of nucleoside diphosphate kinase
LTIVFQQASKRAADGALPESTLFVPRQIRGAQLAATKWSYATLVVIRCRKLKRSPKKQIKRTQLQFMMKPVHLATDAISPVRNSVFPEVGQLEQRKAIQPALRQSSKSFIYITSNDHRRLLQLLEIAKSNHFRDRGDLIGLEAELKRAVIVDSKEVPADVITMNSQADLVDLDTGEKVTFTVVFPRNANVDEGRISVLAPLGAAMLGYRAGDEFEWKVPYGTRRFKVAKILYQPEAAGEDQ